MIMYAAAAQLTQMNLTALGPLPNKAVSGIRGSTFCNIKTFLIIIKALSNYIYHLLALCRTGYVGTFLNGMFVSGVSSHLVDSSVDDRGVMVPVMENDTDIHTRIAGHFPDPDDPQALLADPYESRLVSTGPSSIPGAGCGLHARVSLESNTVVSFYHGQKVRPEDFNPDSWDGNCYKIFDPSDYPRGTIDIPLWAQVSPV